MKIVILLNAKERCLLEKARNLLFIVDIENYRARIRTIRTSNTVINNYSVLFKKHFL